MSFLHKTSLRQAPAIHPFRKAEISGWVDGGCLARFDVLCRNDTWLSRHATLSCTDQGKHSSSDGQVVSRMGGSQGKGIRPCSAQMSVTIWAAVALAGVSVVVDSTKWDWCSSEVQQQAGIELWHGQDKHLLVGCG